MSQKCGGRPLTEEQVHAAVLHALASEEKKEARRLGREAEESRIDVQDMIQTLPAQEAIVQMNFVSGTNSLSQVEWLSMEAAMPPEERQTHRNLQLWMQERAKASGVKLQEEDEDEDVGDDPELAAFMNAAEGDGDKDDDDDEDEAPAPAKGNASKKAAEEDEEMAKEIGTVDKQKNWSAVNLAFKESKLAFRGALSAHAFTNWLWYRCIRPKLEDTKSKLPEVDISSNAFGIEEVEEIMGEFMPVMKEKKDKKDKDDKKDKKDDKKDKKDKKDDKEDKKDKKEDKNATKKSKKDKVTLNAKEKLQVQNLIRNMIFGESGKGKTIVTGWVNMIEEKDIAVLVPWEFQVAHVMRQCLKLEYDTKKKKENPDPTIYYEMAQALADATSMIRKQYQFEFPDTPQNQLLPMQDALMLQERFRDGSVGTLRFDLLWYLQHGAHLLAGSSFAKRHKSTVFKPFKIQELMIDALCSPGPQLVFGIAPPGTGKTAVVSHVLNMFPGHTLVFCCAALPVVLGVGRISNTLGIPYAFVKGRRITPSYACGRGLSTHVDHAVDTTSDEAKGDARDPLAGKSALYSLRYTVIKLNLERKKKRLAEKKRLRNLFDLKRMPRMFLMCDVSSCAWLLRQLDPNRTILVVDEPPMGSDRFPEAPEQNPLSCAMVQAMMTSPYKTIWMSATLPRCKALPTLVSSWMERFRLPMDKQDNHVTECFSTQLDRGALMCGPSGHVAFPHQKCVTADDLRKLCERLPGDPLVLKAYTERALASLLERWKVLEKENKVLPGFAKKAIRPEVKFADLSELNHASIRGYAVDILEWAAAEGNDELVKGFCEVRDDGEASTFPVFNLVEMLFSNAYAFPGLTLVADDDPSGQLLSMSRSLQEQMPKASELEDDIRAQEAETKKQEKFAEEGEVVETSQPRLKFSADLVIQSEQFLKRWCPNRPKNAPTIPRLLPTVKDFTAIKELPVDERWQMLALSGAGTVDPKLDVDPGNPVYTQWVHESMTANKLACVTAGKEFTWGANVPASTVVVTKSFADTTSVAGMLQYVGRAARRGLTTHGQAIFEQEEDLDRIFASPDGLSTEALTMERYAEWWRSGGQKW